MRIIQSLYINNGIEDKNGWLSAEFHWMSWALSCLQLKALYGRVELYSNTAGKEVLVDQLELPFDDTHMELDAFEPVHPSLWAQSKILVYALQNEPFMHIDGDVFLWERFNDQFHNAPVSVQNTEEDDGQYYQSIADEVDLQEFWLPDCVLILQKALNKICAYNCGLIGGTDINLFKYYADTVLEFLDRNKSKISTLKNPEKLNVFFEQYFLYCILKEKKIQPACYFSKAIAPTKYISHLFANFLDVPHKTKFIHTIGSYKQDFDTCLMLAKRLLKDYPSYYFKILEQCKKKNVPTILKTDFEDTPNNYIHTFYRTKLNITNLNYESAMSVNDNDLLQIINQTDLSWKKEQLLELYNYELQIGLLKKSADFNDLFVHQKKQFNQVETIFSDPSSLETASFKTIEGVEYVSVGMDFTKKWHLNSPNAIPYVKKYKIAISPESLIGNYKEIFCDDLDVYLLQSTNSEKTLSEIKKDLLQYFDEEEVSRNYQNFEFIVQSRLKYAIFNNLVGCETKSKR